MKNLLKYAFALGIITVLYSCNESEDLVTADALEGGLMPTTTSSVNYVVGNTGPYTLEFELNQREEIYITEIAMHKSFSGSRIFTATDGSDSIVTYSSDAEVLNDRVISSLSTSSDKFQYTDYTYEQLVAGLTVDGGDPLPASDGGLNIGDAFTFRVETTLSDGRVVTQNYNVSFAVSTRFAGTYTVVESSYIHPTAGDQGNWNGDEIVIVSVDAITYQILANGPFSTDADSDNEFYFTVDPETLEIDIPKEYRGELQTVWGGADEVANCDDNPAELPDVPCAGSNIAEQVDSGADILTMTHGYIRSSGTRQFYYKLVKNI